jgi:hypothetical protein
VTLADLNRTRRIENLAIVFGLLSLIVVAMCRPYMDQPTVSAASAVRG